MRFYDDFPAALNELKRELAEMSHVIHTASFQNKNIADDPDMETMELANYQYLVTQPKWQNIPLKNPDWFRREFDERTSGLTLNPGAAWELRRKTWEPFLNKKGRFDYTYPERMAGTLDNVIQALRQDKFTRRAFLPIFDRVLDGQHDFQTRIPCSLGYWFYYRGDKLNVTYLQRSADFGEHFNNDIALADRLKCYIAERCNMAPGTFSHWLGSLHCFKKDVKFVF